MGGFTRKIFAHGVSEDGAIASSQLPVDGVALGACVATPTSVVSTAQGGIACGCTERRFQNVSRAPLLGPSEGSPPASHSRLPSPTSMSVKTFS